MLRKLSAADLFWFPEVTSTMDKIRELSSHCAKMPIFGVISEIQTKGRGTRGRNWYSASNNMYLTISLDIRSIPIPLTQIPLRMGTILYPLITAKVDSSSNVKLKWPNDVLINGKKICGVLMELDDNRLIIGIGCNVGSSPCVPDLNSSFSQSDIPDLGRPSTCLADHSSSIKDFLVSHAAPLSFEEVESNPFPHHQLAVEIFFGLKNWIEESKALGRDSLGDVIQQFSDWMDKEPQKLRPDRLSTYVTSSMLNLSNESVPNSNVTSESYDPIEQTANRLKSGIVHPLRLNEDGTLIVRNENNEEIALVADYLW